SLSGEPWVILDSRYGAATSNPTLDELTHAIEELYVENLPGMSPGDYQEHGAASVRYGHDGGPMYVLEVSRLGTVAFEEWADQDFETPLSPRKELSSVPKRHALQLWVWLAGGELESIRNQNWRDP